MDDTPLWLDMPGGTTVSRSGERTISIHTTGHDKGRFTVILAAMADGRKLKLYVVFKGVRPVAALMATPGVVVAFSKNGRMNEALAIDRFTRVWGGAKLPTTPSCVGCIQVPSNDQCEQPCREVHQL